MQITSHSYNLILPIKDIGDNNPTTTEDLDVDIYMDMDTHTLIREAST